MVVLRPHDKQSADYLFIALRSDSVTSQIQKLTFGSAQPQLTVRGIATVEIPIPPIPEQRAIAEALGDVDALIAAQEKLIAKKRAIKTATMQRLLTGKQRLPGFGEGCGYKQTEIGVIPDDWDVSRLIELGTQAGGTTPPRAQFERYYGNGVHNWVKTLDLNNSDIKGTEERVTDAALQETSLRIFPKGTILVAMYGGFQQIGRTGLLQKPAATNQAISAIIPSLALAESRFVLEWLNFRVDYWRNVASSSRKDPNITSRDVANFPLPRPELKEQKAIAQVLKDINSEISALEKRLAKTKAIKQGMMQELLTGRTRLV
jgi:type I restriction enzyme S subunit